MNHEPVTVVVTFLGVLAARRYVVLVRHLAEAARNQAVATREQAEAAGSRPYLSVEITPGSTHGPGPAVLIRARLVVGSGEQVVADSEG